jgi:hypothetical protein
MQTITDSNLSFSEAIKSKQDIPFPESVTDFLEILTVDYICFDDSQRTGQIVIHKNLKQDVIGFFTMAKDINFPIFKVQPAVLYDWDDQVLMDKNISSGFNYRKIAGTDLLSAHSLGRAIDINPRTNPYFRFTNNKEIVEPLGAIYDPKIRGALYAGHELVEYMKSLGWEWGGDWTRESGRIDYQHFEKRI